MSASAPFPTQNQQTTRRCFRKYNFPTRVYLKIPGTVPFYRGISVQFPACAESAAATAAAHGRRRENARQSTRDCLRFFLEQSGPAAHFARRIGTLNCAVLPKSSAYCVAGPCKPKVLRRFRALYPHLFREWRFLTLELLMDQIHPKLRPAAAIEPKGLFFDFREVFPAFLSYFIL